MSFLEEIKKANNRMKDTVVIDLDGVIVDFDNCPNKGICDYSTYPDDTSRLKRTECLLNPDAVFFLNLIKTHLHLKIIILTARVESERTVTEKWLKDNDVPYTDLVMDKPRGLCYIDDLGHKFTDWKSTYTEIEKLSRIINDQ